jgi:hypothetical protein
VRPGASAHRAARRRLLRLAQARRRLLHLRRASRCLGTSRGTSRSSSRCTSSTTPPRAGSPSTTWPTPRVRVPQHVERLVVWLIIDYFTSRRFVRHASGCLGTSRSSSSATSPTPRVRVSRHVVRLVVNYSASRRLIVDYFAYAARLGASAHRAARRRLLRLAQARRRLLRLRRTSGCLGTSPRLSSTTSPTPRVRVLRHVVRLVMWLVVDYFAYVVRSGASARRAAHHVVRRQLLCAPQLRLAATLALLQPRRALRLLVSRQHRLYFEYAARCRNVVFRSHHVDHSSRLVFQTSRERQSHTQ